MDMPKLLLMPLGDGGDDADRLSAALRVAKALDAHLRVMHTVLEAQSLLPRDIALPKSMLADLDQAVTRHADRDSERLQALFAQLCTGEGVDLLDAADCSRGFSASWFEARGVRSALVARHGKLADWVVLSRPPGGRTTASFEAAVFESGRAVLIVPRRMESFTLDTLMIAWNGSPEAVRAIASALPLMNRARRVLLVTSRPGASRKPALSEVADYLALHGVAAETRILECDTATIGETLAGTAQAESVSILVMGAYSTHRVRDLMFGGVTRYLLEHCDLPLLMAH